jgi:hypothetical protein
MRGLLVLLVSLLVFTNVHSAHGLFFGKVRDQITHTPITRAQLRILPLDTVVTSGLNGEFQISQLPVGEYSFSVSASGYESFASPLYMLNSVRPQEVNFFLRRASGEVAVLEAVEVEVEPTWGLTARGHEPVGTIRLSAQDLMKSPSSMGDVSRIVQTLPGVTIGNDQLSDFNVRGGSSVENTFILNGIPAPRISHFELNAGGNGRINNINMYLVDEVAFHNGAYSARFPDKLSSVMEVRYREGNNVRHTGMFTLDMAGVGGLIEGPTFSVKEQAKGSYAVAGRMSYLEGLNALGLFDLAGVPDYKNAHVKLHQPLGAGQLRVNVFAGTDEISMETIRKDTSLLKSNMLQFATTTIIGGAEYAISKAQNKTSVLFYFHHMRDSVDIWNTTSGAAHGYLANTRLLDSLNIAQKIQSTGLGLKADYTHILNEVVSLHTGVDHRMHQHLLRESLGAFPVYVPQMNSYFIQEPMSSDVKRTWGSMSSAYAEALFYLKGLEWILGYRHHYDDYNQNHGFGPRAGLRIPMGNTHVFKSGAGLHHQSHGWQDQRDLPKDAAMPTSLHTVMGVESFWPHNIFSSVEIFYKHSRNLARNASLVEQERAVQVKRDSGEVRAKGLELYMRKNFAQKFHGAATYTYLHTREKNQQDVWQKNYQSIPHQFNIAVGYDFTSGFAMSTRYTYASGTPYTPFDVEKSIQQRRGIPDESRLFGEQHKDIHRFDLRFEFRDNFQKLSIVSFFEITNVLNRKNVYHQFWDDDAQKAAFWYGYGLFPVGGVAISF